MILILLNEFANSVYFVSISKDLVSEISIGILKYLPNSLEDICIVVVSTFTDLAAAKAAASLAAASSAAASSAIFRCLASSSAIFRCLASSSSSAFRFCAASASAVAASFLNCLALFIAFLSNTIFPA